MVSAVGVLDGAGGAPGQVLGVGGVTVGDGVVWRSRYA